MNSILFLNCPSRVLLFKDNNNAQRLVCLLSDDYIIGHRYGDTKVKNISACIDTWHWSDPP